MSAVRTESHKAAFLRFHDAVTGGGAPDVIAGAVDELAAPDLVFHAPVPTGLTGTQALKQVWTVLLRAFPDIRVTIEDVVAEGDKVVFRNTVTGTHLGEYRGLAPTGRKVEYAEIFIVRFTPDSRIAEIRGVVDVLSQLRQLGLLSDPFTSTARA
ncbi:ester cyclase [Streptomyces sp. NPDC053367]|uniref:ester cyclase n=1 Tax=Streptomyces sp. NPDC053367 TaxID=3365700 RepID=UPI0037D88DB5